MSLSSIDELQLPQTIELRQPVIYIPNPRLDASSPFIWIIRKFLSFLYILAISLSFKLQVLLLSQARALISIIVLTF